MNSTLWTAVRKNQNERYHHLAAARIGDTADLPDLFMDFKKVYRPPTENLYRGVASGGNIQSSGRSRTARYPSSRSAAFGRKPLARVDIRARVVMELLGHSQISLTMDTYSHTVPEILRGAIDKLGAALNG